MKNKTINKFVIGNWYKDEDGDFIKFNGFDEDLEYVKYSACIAGTDYHTYEDDWAIECLGDQCIPMTIDEMKEYLPEEEWWIKPTNEMFPIY
jgi:hypothetical protein